MPRKSDYVADVQNNVTKMIDGYNGLRANLREYIALGYGDPAVNPITPEDLQGSTVDVNPEDLANLLGVTVPAIETFLAAGHATNMYKLRK